MIIAKVNVLPAVLDPSTIYLVRLETSKELMIYVTDALGAETYQSKLGAVSEEEIVGLISALRNQPDGLAGINEKRILDTSVRLDGQNTLFLSDQEEYLWDDIVAHFEVRQYSGANNPTFGTFLGNQQGALFSPSTMNQAWCDFHIKHDIALGTKLYPHIHWLPVSNKLGRVRWGFEYIVAKGHGQQAFTAPVTVYAEQNITVGSMGVHMVTEVVEADAVPPTHIEPDSVVKIRVFRDAAHARDTYPDEVHAWCCDLHYQKTRFGTIRKAPNFYGVP